MNAHDFTYLLNQSLVINDKQTDEIKQIIRDFPYFQAARAIYLKGLKNQDSYQYNQELKTTAAYTTDRSILFDYITSTVFNQSLISNDMRQLEEKLKALDVIFEEVKGYEEADFSENEPVLDPDLFEAKEPSPEEKLEIGKPLAFDANENHSFNEWLKLTTFKPIERASQDDNKGSETSNKNALIDQFLENKPKIKPSKKAGSTKNLAEERSRKPDQLMTETLAKVYLEQKNYNKAIQAYKILSLKYPEKSSFFADRIKEIKKII